MQRLDLHRKVTVWYGEWWAVQLVRMLEISLGFRVEPRRRFVDIYLGPITIAIGHHAVLTDPRLKGFDSCRGFLFADAEEARVI
jgi:hypothetical protein